MVPIAKVIPKAKARLTATTTMKWKLEPADLLGPSKTTFVCAWLNNSIDGNNKKGDIYWKDVAADYNENSPSDRKRTSKNCKDHWSRTNKKVVSFHGVYCRMRDAYASGQCDLQLVKKALKMYKEENEGQNFTLIYWWDKVKEHHKWSRHAEVGKSKEDGSNKAKEDRPTGTKAAKAKRKGKAQEDIPMGTLSHDDVQLYYDTHALRASSQEKMAEVQLRLSKEKLEISKAKERTKMAATYKELLMADTSRMDEFQKLEHRRATKHFSDMLFGDDNSSE